jgi:hypothetical protein
MRPSGYRRAFRGFSQEDQSYQENLVTVIKQVSGQLRATDASVLIPDIVDDTVFQLLRALGQGLLKLSFTSSSGNIVDLAEDGLGELGGWYMGIPGWRSTYSEERFVDDFSVLK